MIKYVIGDATDPQGDDTKFIVHICNDIGAWGAGFVMALSAKWPEPESWYKDWSVGRLRPYEFNLGQVQCVPVGFVGEFPKCTFVVNMIAQHGVRSKDNPSPIRYDALTECLTKVSESARSVNASIHMPRIGCGLAGGSWDKVEAIINATMPDLSVTVYDLE
jgi:O-acetyl-ADP-ribose deacetylase (regulator of RNase III)